MCESLNLHGRVAVEGVGCVFTNFCGGHSFPLWLLAPLSAHNKFKLEAPYFWDILKFDAEL